MVIATERRSFPVLDPADGSVIDSVESAEPEDGIAAVDAAADAAEDWAARAPRERAEILRRAFDLMIAQRDEIARLIVREMGKPLAEARGEAAYAAEFLRWFSEEAVRASGDYAIAPGGANRMLVAHAPIGIALLITPWNFPAAMATRKIGPALAAGCTVVLKPAEETPLTALAIVALLEEAGVPEGVDQRRHHRRPGAAHRGDAHRPARAQAVLHGLDRRRAPAARAGRAERDLDARWSSAATRPSWCSHDADIDLAVAGAMDGEDAQRRRGLHGRQPLPRARVGRRGVHGAADRGDGRGARRPRLRARRRSSAR